jgi:hypothetical protein
MASEASKPPTTDDPGQELTKEELLRQAYEALAQGREHRKRFFEALERLEKRAR